jgi:RimJ/RimL family protein N-acetyltransferase
VIETPRLSLRELSTADDEFIVMLMNEPAYIQHIGDRGIRTLEKARSYILEKYTASYAKFGYGLYLVELKGQRIPVGICGFVRRDMLEHPDIGFALLREYWSQGFAYEAASAMLDYGRRTLGLKVVLALTSPGNQASIRLLERLGLRYQKLIRVPPVDRDSMLFSTEGKQG